MSSAGFEITTQPEIGIGAANEAYARGMYGFFKRSRLQNLLGQAGGSIFIVLLTWGIADHTVLLTYLAIHQLLVACTAFAYYSKFTNSRISADGLPRFVTPIGILTRTFCGSIFWLDMQAASGFTFVVSVFLVLCSSVVGVFVTLGPLKRLARQTLICLLLPGSLACFFLGHWYVAFAVSYFLYVVAYRGAHQMHNAYQELINLREQSLATAAKLAKNNQALQNTNQNLENEVARRRQTEREREALQTELVEASREAGKAEIATDVLHNVGNVMNSVNVSLGVVHGNFRDSFQKQFQMAIEILESNQQNLGDFFTTNPRSKHFVPFLNELNGEATHIYEEIMTLRENVDHVIAVVAAQQSFATTAGIVSKTNPKTIIESAIQISSESFRNHNIELERDFKIVPDISVDKQKLIQIFVNLFRNATNAIMDTEQGPRNVTVRLYSEDDQIVVEVADTGVGIKPSDMSRIFQHGFSTRKGRGGHGFGLHHSICAIGEMGGSLNANSDGPGKGATFTVRFPATADLSDFAANI